MKKSNKIRRIPLPTLSVGLNPNLTPRTKGMTSDDEKILRKLEFVMLVAEIRGIQGENWIIDLLYLLAAERHGTTRKLGRKPSISDAGREKIRGAYLKFRKKGYSQPKIIELLKPFFYADVERRKKDPDVTINRTARSGLEERIRKIVSPFEPSRKSSNRKM